MVAVRAAIGNLKKRRPGVVLRVMDNEVHGQLVEGSEDEVIEMEKYV